MITKKLKKTTVTIALLAGVLFCMTNAVQATGNIDTANKYAWGTNIGWVSFNPTNGGVTVYSDHLEGYAWAENIGYIRLGSYTGGGVHTYANTSATDYGVNNNSGTLSGYAWSKNAGWIKFNPTNGGVTIDATGKFDGYAWSENVGWIHFKNDNPAYNVATTSEPPLLAELASFTATPFPDSVLLQWETWTEIDNMGFHILRSDAREGFYNRITPAMIFSKSDFSLGGAEYDFRDEDVGSGETYFYKLEDIDTANISMLHGPVSATVPLFGDINKDSSVDSRDIRELSMLMRKETISPEELAIGDLNGNERLDRGDILRLKQIIRNGE